MSYKDLGNNDVRLNPTLVKRYITNNPAVTEQEMVFFLKQCEAMRLNPFLKEIYLVKYGSQPAAFVTGKEAFLKRAKRDPGYRGHVVVVKGSIPEMTATAEVHVEGYAVPISVTVEYEEYVARKRDGSPNSMWSNKPKTMLRKVALVQALREAFPDALSGMYAEEEIHEDYDYEAPAHEVKAEVRDEIADRQEKALEKAEVEEEDPAEAELKAKKAATAEKRKATIARKKAEAHAAEKEEAEANATAEEEERKANEKMKAAAEANPPKEPEAPATHDEGTFLEITGRLEQELGTPPSEQFDDLGAATPEYIAFILLCFQVAFEASITIEMLEEYIGHPADAWMAGEKGQIFAVYGQLQEAEDIVAALPVAFPKYYKA